MTLANIITFIRIPSAVGLLFCPLFGRWFWGLYLAGGISDMIDGPIARWTKTASQRGATFDSVADFYWASLHKDSSSQAALDKLASSYQGKYPEEVKIMKFAFDCFCGKSIFAHMPKTHVGLKYAEGCSF